MLSNRSARVGEARVSDWTAIDYFSDESLIEDPYPYFEDLRAECPVSYTHLTLPTNREV